MIFCSGFAAVRQDRETAEQKANQESVCGLRGLQQDKELSQDFISALVLHFNTNSVDMMLEMVIIIKGSMGNTYVYFERQVTLLKRKLKLTVRD